MNGPRERLHAKLLFVAAAVAIAAVGVVMLFPRSGKHEIVILAEGAMRRPLELLIREYRQSHPDVQLYTSYGEGADAVVQIQMTGRGDIFVAHDPFMPWAAKKGFVSEWFTAGYFDVALVVPKGNPKHIQTLADLGKPGIRLGIGDRKHSTTGVVTAAVIRQLPDPKAVLGNIALETHGSPKLCAAVRTGALDAAIVWAPVAREYPDSLEIHPIPEQYLDAVTSATYGRSDLRNIRVAIGIVKRSANRSDVRAFYRFLKTHARDAFKRCGFRETKR